MKSSLLVGIGAIGVGCVYYMDRNYVYCVGNYLYQLFSYILVVYLCFTFLRSKQKEWARQETKAKIRESLCINEEEVVDAIIQDPRQMLACEFHLSNAQIDEISSWIQFIIETYINPWYSELSSDQTFIQQLTLGLSYAAGRVFNLVQTKFESSDQRVSLFSSLCLTLQRHIRLVQVAQRSVMSKESFAIAEDDFKTALRIAEAIDNECIAGHQLHPASVPNAEDPDWQSLDASAYEKSYLRQCVSKFLHQAMHPRDSGCTLAVTLTVELLVSRALIPATRMITPSLINSNFAVYFQKHILQSVKNYQEIYKKGRVPAGHAASDLGWRSFAGVVSEEEVDEQLKGQESGTYVIRKTQSPVEHEFSVSFIEANGTVRHIECKFLPRAYSSNQDNIVYESLTGLLQSVKHCASSGIQFTTPGALFQNAQLKSECSPKSNQISLAETTTDELHREIQNVLVDPFFINVDSVPTRSRGATIVPSTRPDDVTKKIRRKSSAKGLLRSHSNLKVATPPARPNRELNDFIENNGEGYVSDSDIAAGFNHPTEEVGSIEAEVITLHARRRQVLVIQFEVTVVDVCEMAETNEINPSKFRAMTLALADVLLHGLKVPPPNALEFISECTVDDAQHEDYLEALKSSAPFDAFVKKSICRKAVMLRFQAVLNDERYHVGSVWRQPKCKSRLLKSLEKLDAVPLHLFMSPEMQRSSSTRELTLNRIRSENRQIVRQNSKSNDYFGNILRIRRTSEFQDEKRTILSELLTKTQRPSVDLLKQYKILREPYQFIFLNAGIFGHEFHDVAPGNSTGFSLPFENKQIVKYLIRVEFNHDAAWTIKRRYSDFLTVYSSIRSFYPNFHFAFPPKRTFGNLEASVITQRTVQLNRFLHAVMTNRFVVESSEIMQFLEFDRNIKQRPMTLPSPLDESNTTEWLLGDTVASPSSEYGNNPGSFTVEELDQQHFEEAEEALFEVLSQLFELSKLSVIRRQLLMLTRRVIALSTQRALLGKLNELVDLYMSEEMCLKLLEFGRAHLAQSIKIQTTDRLSPTSRALKQHQQEKIQAEQWQLGREFLLNLFPTALVSALGQESISQGMLTIHQLFQCPFVVRSLIYSIADIILLHLLSTDDRNNS